MTQVIRLVFLLIVTGVLAIAAIGCRTAHGFGEDMENAGEGIQQGTK